MLVLLNFSRQLEELEIVLSPRMDKHRTLGLLLCSLLKCVGWPTIGYSFCLQPFLFQVTW